jgi:hypothetical protein
MVYRIVSTMSEVLPPLYQAWMDALLPATLPAEERATCLDCAMAPKLGHGPPDTWFDPSTKCCTWYPELSNFLVGRILADDDPGNAHGRRGARARIAARAAVTPLGIWPTPVYESLYDQSVRAVSGTFGHVPALRCPYYVEPGGLCGIWRHRDAVCSTWFCKFMRGARGAVFWQLVKELLRSVESALRAWCLTQIDLGADALRATWIAEGNRRRRPIKIDAFAMAGAADPGDYARMWGRYAGREEELYSECARIVGALTWPEALAIGGGPAQVGATLVVDFFERLRGETPLPERVARGPALVQIGVPGRARVHNASNVNDPLELPARAVEAVPRLAGGPLAEMLAKVQAEGVPVDEAMVRRMLDWELLVSA